jgi:peptidoglycan/xylan/chitin deacetylase (PgdA/CDA1 family)
MMVDCKRWIKRGIVKSGLPSLAGRLKGPRTVILRYHSVQVTPSDYDNSLGKGIVHSVTAFREQMEWLARTFEPVTVEEVASAVVGRRAMPRRGVLITFDDGYADNFDLALPVLNHLGIKAAFYITVDCVEPEKIPWFCRLRYAFAATDRQTWPDPSGKRVWRLSDVQERRQAFLSTSGQCALRSGAAQDDWVERVERGLAVGTLAHAGRLMMDWEQIRALHRQGHTVGSHTLSHPNIAQLSREAASWELRESKRRLEEKLGAPVSHFSYPSPILQPHWSAGTMECCREHGYRTAMTCTPGAVVPGDSPLCLKRIPAPEALEDFKWAVQCAFLGHTV